MATPMLAALKQVYPQALIDVAVGSWSRAVLMNNPAINRLLDCGAVGQGRYSLMEVWRLSRQLRLAHYDLAITLDRSPVVGLVPWLAGIPHRVGLDSYGRGFAHTLRVPVPLAPRHEAQLYLDCVRQLTRYSWSDDPALFPTAFYPSPVDAATLPPLPASPIVLLHPTGGINPGMQMLNKRWPPDNWATLARQLLAHGCRVLFTGTAADVSLCREITAALSANSGWQIVAGKLTVGQLGALCQQSALFVGGDTGAMHLAVATGCKTVAIFGPTDPRRYGPFAPPRQAVALWHPLPLPSGGVGQGTVTDFHWDHGVGVAEVWQACLNFLPAPDYQHQVANDS